MLEIKNITKSYSKKLALDNLSMSVAENDLIGLLGPNGAGKSTLISIISGILGADSGSISFDGEDVFKNHKLLQKNLGVVPQEIALYENLSGIDNLRFFSHAYGLRGAEIDSAIERVKSVIRIDDKLKNKVSTYSGGMKRRLNIGVALLHNPKLLIMDEPTVGIDPQSRNHILESVKSLNKSGITVIYTTHYMEEVDNLCNKFYIMDFGKIIASGTREEIRLSADLKVDASLEEVFLHLTGRALRD